MRARFIVGDIVLMGLEMQQERFELAKGFPVSVGEERADHAPSEGKTARMPVQETFQAVRFGMLVDRFGIPWMVNCEKAS